MSRIAVVTSSPPMVEGGHLVIARSLVQALRDAGHHADVIITPANRFGRQASAYLATWLTDVGTSDGRRIDQVISLRFPSYAVRHEKHVCWLNHTMREYYDLWSRFSATLPPAGLLKERTRRVAIRTADRYLLGRNVTKLFVQSRTVQQRLAMWPEVKSTVLHPPAPHRAYRCDRYADYIFMVSRLTALKRADLLIEALATAEGAGIKAVIAGDGEDRTRLEALVDRHDLRDRVMLAGHLAEPELLDHLARCRAVCFPPVLEDYGFVTVEAFASRKAVVTCHDSGGPAELVADGVHGFVCDPTPAAVASALRKLIDDPVLAERMGASAFAAGAELNWADAVRQLTA
ncbi:MAG: glycosyltransferase family 4 protein [Acidobacteria bacterium]|nr:glycosyltransferase family 4 protein [Acidobacteriota bacterium]